MAVTKAFYEAVNSDNVRRVRLMMKDSLLGDPSFKEFKEMEKVAVSMHNLYDYHDGSVFELNKEKWDDDYMAKQMVQVVRNFSHERIEHLKDIVQYLHPDEEVLENNQMLNGKCNDSINRNIYEGYTKRKEYEKQDDIGAKVVVGAVVGAVAGGVVASVAGVTVVGGAVVGAVIGGIAVPVVISGGH